MRLSARLKAGFYPTPDAIAQQISRMISPTFRNQRGSGNLNVIDPCCGEGDALQTVVAGIAQKQNLTTYGVELHPERARQAAGKLDNVLNADLFNTAIGRERFSLCYLNPPYDNEATQAGERTEESFLQAATRYLMPDGLLVLVIPQNQLEKLSTRLAQEFNSISVYAFPKPHYAAYKQVVVFGRRREAAIYTGFTEIIARCLMDSSKENLPELPETEILQFNYQPWFCPFDYKEGRVSFSVNWIDPRQAVKESRESGVWKNLEVANKFWPATDTVATPLLPLRRGHLALLVTAGMLNNLLVEHQGQRLLCKSMDKKEYKITEITETKIVSREKMNLAITTLDLDTGEVSQIEQE